MLSSREDTATFCKIDRASRGAVELVSILSWSWVALNLFETGLPELIAGPNAKTEITAFAKKNILSSW